MFNISEYKFYKDIHIKLAEVAYNKKLYWASARLLAKALEVLSNSREDGYPWDHRYDAARSGVLAGTGKGKDNPPPDDAQRSRLRKQALEWLTTDLVAWSKILQAVTSRDTSVFRRRLLHWKTDPDLSGIRDEAELALLPSDEREAWQNLWVAVDELLEAKDATPEQAEAAKRLAPAWDAYHMYQHATAARLFAAAFAERPALADNPTSGHRYLAACCAALATAGQRMGDPPDADYTRWRRQALDWLRADLKAWETLARSPSGQRRDPVPWALRRWRADPHLSSLRDDWALAALPESERRACHALWAEVDEVIKAAGGPVLPPYRVKDGELLAPARYAESQFKYGTAARLFAAAFAERPTLADNPAAGHRFQAARCAALAAAGKSWNDPPLPGEDRTRRRRQALDWLRADLKAWETLARSPSGGLRSPVARALQHWKTDHELASVRDESALAVLPEADRQACRDLWAEVDRLIKAAGGPAPLRTIIKERILTSDYWR